MSTYSIQQVARAAGCTRDVLETWMVREQFVPSMSTVPGKARAYTAYDLARATITAHTAAMGASLDLARKLANVWELDFRRMSLASKPRIGLIVCTFGQPPLVSAVPDLKRALKDVPYYLNGGAGLMIVDLRRQRTRANRLPVGHRHCHPRGHREERHDDDRHDHHHSTRRLSAIGQSPFSCGDGGGHGRRCQRRIQRGRHASHRRRCHMDRAR